MRVALAILIVGLAASSAVYLSALKLNSHGHYNCEADQGLPALPGSPVACDATLSYWSPGRATWQLPVSILIAAVGLASAAAIVLPRREP
jgi:hypothetical protein